MTGQGFYDALSWNAAFWTATIVYGLACTGAGFLVIRLIAGPGAGRTHESPSAFLAVAVLLGFGFLGQFWMLLAIGGLMTPPFVYSVVGVMVVAAAVFGRRHARVLVRDLCMARIALRRERLGVRVLLIAAVAWLFATFAGLGRPLSGDPLALHMMAAKMAAAAGKLERYWFQPGNEYFGLLGEMSYAVLIQLGNVDAAQMSTWVMVFAIAGVLLGVCRRTGLGLRGQVIAIAAFASTTAVLSWVGEGKIDLLSSSLAFAALYLLIPRADLAPLPRSDLMIAGLLAGFAITTKLMLVFCLVVANGVLLLWTYAPASFRSRRPWQGLRARALLPLVSAGLLYAAFTLIGFAPQFVKNGVLLGAPFAPLGTDYTAWLVQERWYGAETVAHIRRFYPFVLTFGEYFAQYGQLSVLVLAFLPLTLYLRRPPSFWQSPLTAVTVAAWLAIAFWATFQGDKVVTRYILPVLLLCIPLAAAGAEHVTARGFRPRFLGTIVIAACFASLYMTASFTTGFYFFPMDTAKVVFGTALPCDRGLPFCEAMNIFNRAAPPGARVFSVLSYKYYMRPDLIQCSYDHRTVPFLGSTEEERWRWFYDQGYSFILPYPSGNPGHLLHDLANPPPWVVITRYRPDNPNGPIHISYDLTKGGPTTRPQVACQRTGRDAWEIVRTAQ